MAGAFTEQGVFFGATSQGPLYGFVYLPEEAARPGLAVVMASPLGRERLRCYRELVSLARALAARGHAVLRFDYRGEGESPGSFTGSTLADRVRDLGSAARELRRRGGPRELCLLGVHLGADLALMAADELGARRLVLAEPVTSPRRYARTLLRSNVVLQTHYFGQVRQDKAALRQALARGEAVSVYGFQLGRALLDELEALDPEPLLEAYTGRADLIYLAPRQVPPRRDLKRWRELLERGGGQVSDRCAVLNFSWTSRKRWTPRLEPLNSAVLAALEVTK